MLFEPPSTWWALLDLEVGERRAEKGPLVWRSEREWLCSQLTHSLRGPEDHPRAMKGLAESSVDGCSEDAPRECFQQLSNTYCVSRLV